MVQLQATRFYHAAVQSGLIDAARLAECWGAIPPEKRTADAADRRLARRAIEAGHLSLWQAQQLLMGRTGFRFDRYELTSLVGEGGMGRVYLARDTKLNRMVALKVLSRERMNIPRAINRFHREARVGAQLQHENLVRIYDQGEANGHHFLVMEFIEGKTVGALIQARGALPPPIAARLARQIALGLEHAHRKGMVHRDVNPMNILVDGDGMAKLTDLGLAIGPGELEGQVTREGATVGTFDYIAPEQARHSRNVDSRADVYSLGCSLYHMLAGRVPFPQPSLPEKLYAHQALMPEPLPTLAPAVPEGLDEVVRRMMAKSPDDRYATAQEAAEALEPFAGGPATLAAIESAQAQAATAALASASAAADWARGGLTRPGSDMDLGTQGNEPSGTPGSTGSGQLDLLPKIDFGPVPSLSDSLSGDRASVDSKSRARLWVGAGVALALVMAAALALRGAGWADVARRPTTNNPPPPPVTTPRPGANDPSTDVFVRWGDGTSVPEANLREAIRRAAGKPAEVVLRNARPLRFDVDSAIEAPEGGLVIRAGEGAAPILAVTLKGPAPFLKTPSKSRLTLIGLTIEAETSAKAAGGHPTVIEAGGDVTLTRCHFSTSGRDPGLRAVAGQGFRATLTGCLFDGFDSPLAFTTYPDSQLRLEHCMVVGEPSTAASSGWALSLRGRAGQLQVDRCTIVGRGLLAAEGFTAEQPLRVEAFDTIVRGPALLLWPDPKAEFAKAVRWSGRGNRYEIGSPAWVVLSSQGFAGPPNSPPDLKAWTEATAAEPGTREGPVKLASGDTPTPGPHQPTDFAPTDPADSSTGADPALVGPRATRSK
jgi:serine/threonine protein kinase